MKNIIILIFTFSNLLFGICNTEYKEKDAIITTESKTNSIQNVYCPSIKTNNEDCHSFSFKYTNLSNIKCIYYELETSEVSDFKKLEKENIYLSSKNTNANLNSINNTISLTEQNEKVQKLNEEIFQLNEGVNKKSNVMDYFPSFDTNILSNLMKNTDGIVNINYDFGTSITTQKNVCSKCQSEIHQPSVQIDNIIANLNNEITDLENQIKKQSSDVVGEIGSTLYDLTSDEAVLTYYITGLSYAVATASCSIKQNIGDVNPELLNVSEKIADVISSKNTQQKNDTEDAAKQSESTKVSGCMLIVNGACLIPMPLAGFEFGIRDKEFVTGKNSKETENEAVSQTISEIKYEECMKTEPDRIMNKILGYLKNLSKGVEVDLFATKQCSDEYLKNKWQTGLGTYSKEDEEIEIFMLENFINEKISNIDYYSQQAVGYLDSKHESLFNISDNMKNKNDGILSKYNDNINTMYNNLDKSDYINNTLYKKYILDKNNNNSINKIINYQIDGISDIYNELIGVNTIFQTMMNDMENKYYTKNLISEIININSNTILDLNKDITNLFKEIGNEKQKTFKKKISCIEYSGVNCVKVGVKFDFYGNLNEKFYNYKSINLFEKYNIFKNKSLEYIESYITNDVLDGGSFDNIDGVYEYEMLMDYYKVITFKKIITILDKIEIMIAKESISMNEEEIRNMSIIIHNMFKETIF